MRFFYKIIIGILLAYFIVKLLFFELKRLDYIALMLSFIMLIVEKMVFNDPTNFNMHRQQKDVLDNKNSKKKFIAKLLFVIIISMVMGYVFKLSIG